MSDESKTPKAKVEVGGEKDESIVAAGPKPASDAAVADGAQPAQEARQRVTSWVSRTFPGHEKAFWGGVCGLLVALVLFAIGLWRTIVVVVLVGIGVAVGQMAEGDPKLIRALQKFFSGIDR